MLPLADDIDVDARGPVDALLVEGPREGEVARVGREGDRAIVLLEPQLDVALLSRVAEHAEDADSVADLQVLAHEQVGRRRPVFQETSRVTDH